MRACLTLALCLAAGCGGKTEPSDARKTYTERELAALVVGRTAEDAARLLGDPDEARPLELPGSAYWSYKGLVRVPGQDAPAGATLTVVGGRVSTVTVGAWVKGR